MTESESPTTSNANVERTYRRGPSDPVVFADGPGTWVEVEISGSVEHVWETVTDINLAAQFSTEFQGATWISEGPKIGASFVGRNRHKAVGEWEVESFVDEFNPGVVFGWATSDPKEPGARWRYRLRPNGESVILRFEVTLGPGPSGTTMVIASMPDKESRIIHRRIGELNSNMANTVAGIRQIVESR